MHDALSGIFDVADPSGTVTLDSSAWVPGWHAPLLKITKAALYMLTAMTLTTSTALSMTCLHNYRKG